MSEVVRRIESLRLNSSLAEILESTISYAVSVTALIADVIQEVTVA